MISSGRSSRCPSASTIGIMALLLWPSKQREACDDSEPDRDEHGTWREWYDRAGAGASPAGRMRLGAVGGKEGARAGHDRVQLGGDDRPNHAFRGRAEGLLQGL